MNTIELAKDYLAKNAAESGADEIIRQLLAEVERRQADGDRLFKIGIEHQERADGMHRTALAMRDAAIYWMREAGESKFYHAIERMYFDAAVSRHYTAEFKHDEWTDDGQRVDRQHA